MKHIAGHRCNGLDRTNVPHAYRECLYISLLILLLLLVKTPEMPWLGVYMYYL